MNNKRRRMRPYGAREGIWRRVAVDAEPMGAHARVFLVDSSEVV